MQFRQNGQRDERRRRVLRDESLTSPGTAEAESPAATPGSGDPKAPSRGYSAAVAVESQPPISCLIATRPWTLTVTALAGLAVIAGLEAAYTNIFHGSGLSPEVTAALDVTARGSLAAWFSSLVLAMAAVNAVLVYWLRSHKLDDYRGRYRVWLWTALGLIVAAAAAGTGLHAVIGHVIADRFSTPWLRNPDTNTLVLVALIFGSLAIRQAFEVWPSRLATAWGVVAVTGYFTTILFRADLLVVDSVVLTTMAESTTILVANLAVAFTVASYCRYVHLESQDALKPRRQRRPKPVADATGRSSEAEGNKRSTKRTAAKEAVGKPVNVKREASQPAVNSTSTTASDSASTADKPQTRGPLRTAAINSKTIRCDSPHQSRGESRPAAAAPAAQPAALAAQPASTDADDDDDALDFDPETGERLSKAERRRMRKLMRRQKKTGSG